MPREASIGTANAATKVADTSAPPWSKWKPSSLTGRALLWMQTYCILSKGRGAGEPIVLTKWQKDWTEEVLEDESIRASVYSLAKGNGKSGFAGAFGMWALMDEAVAEAYGGQPDIPVIAPSIKQAMKGVYGAALAYRRNHPDIRDRTISYTAANDRRIFAPSSEGVLYPIADDPDTLQGLDPSVALCDEVGWLVKESWETLVAGSGKRPRSLMLGLGTINPLDDDDTNALDELIRRFDEEGQRPGLHMVVARADADGDPADPKQWAKANPSMGQGPIVEDDIRFVFNTLPLPVFKAYRLNLKAGNLAGWLGPDGPQFWDDAHREFEWDYDLPAWIGVDKSAYSDSSAVVTLQNVEGVWLARAKVFIPSPTINHAEVREYIRTECDRLNVEAVGYDDRYFVEGAQDLADEGYPMVKVPQTAARLVGSFVSLYGDIVAGNFWHEGDPVYRSHMLGAVPKPDSSGGFMLAKGRSKVKIDAAVATGIARAVSGVDLEVDDTPEQIDPDELRF